LLDLACELWPLEKERPEAYCRALRFITDASKRDFLLRPWRNSFLVRADFTRAIVSEDRVLFLEPQTATFEEFKPEFLRALRARVESSEERPFELWALECIICANVTMHTMRLQVMGPVITTIVAGMDLHGSERAILRLYPLKVSLSKFIEQVKPLVSCLKDLLDAEAQNQGGEEAQQQPSARERMRCSSVASSVEASFTRNTLAAGAAAAAAAAEEDGQQPPNRLLAGAMGDSGRADSDMASSKSEEPNRSASGFEELLETWAFNAQEVMSDAVEMNANIEDATRFMEASMSYSRTSLLRLELVAMVVGLAFAFGALVSGIFGMNLKSPIFDAPPEDGYFNWAVIGIIVVGLLIVIVSFCLFQRGKRHYRRYCERFGRNEFFRRIEDDEYVLQLSSSEGQELHNRVWRDLRTPAPPLQPYQQVHRLGSAGDAPQRFISGRAGPASRSVTASPLTNRRHPEFPPGGASPRPPTTAPGGSQSSHVPLLNDAAGGAARNTGAPAATSNQRLLIPGRGSEVESTN